MQGEPEGERGSQLCPKGVTGGVRCHSHLHPLIADIETLSCSKPSQILTVPNTQKRHRKCSPQCIHSQSGETQVPSRIQNQGDHFPKINKLSLLCVTLLLRQRVSKLPKLFKKPKTSL